MIQFEQFIDGFHHAFSAANYYLDPFAIPLFMVPVVSLGLSCMIFHREGINPVSYSFRLVSLSVSIWLISFSLMYCSKDAAAAFFWAKVSYLGVPMIPASLYQFTVSVLGIYKENKKSVRLAWTLAALSSLMVIGTGLVIKAVRLYWWGYYPQYRWQGSEYLLYFAGFLFLSSHHFISEYRKARPGSIQKLRIRALMSAFGLSYLALFDYLAKFGVPLYPIGYLPVLICLLLIARAMLRYRLIDITPQFAANSIIDTIEDALFVLDSEGFIRLVNRAAINLFCPPGESITGRQASEIIQDDIFSGRAQKLMEGSIRSFEFAYRPERYQQEQKECGTAFRILRLSASIMRDGSGRPLAAVCIARDITEKKRAEAEIKEAREELEQRVERRTSALKAANDQLKEEMDRRSKMEDELLKMQKLDSIGLLAGGIAHDFNNILTGVIGKINLARPFLEPTARYQDAERAGKSLDDAERALLRAKGLTQRLLTFSKGGNPVKKPCSISGIVRDCCEFSLSGSKAEFLFSSSTGLWPAMVDEGQISQVINNLALNAIQAMPSGGRVSVECRNLDAGMENGLPLGPGKYVEISIKDNGTGIPKKDIKMIFDPFFTTKEHGNGLGLATSYSIIKKHGGHITVGSSQGKGATFNIYLPACQSALPGPEIEEKNETRCGTARILVMDDDDMIRDICCEALSGMGYEVVCVKNGIEAVELYDMQLKAGRKFDLVIMDLTVPGGMGGKEALKKIMEFDPFVQAIVSSGYSNDPVMSDFKEYGFSGVIAKPFKIRELYSILNQVLEKNGKAEKTCGAPAGKNGACPDETGTARIL